MDLVMAVVVVDSVTSAMLNAEMRIAEATLRKVLNNKIEKCRCL